MRFCLMLLLCLAAPFAHPQSEIDALPEHSGALMLDLTGLHVTQRTAKPEGNEIGVRAHDAASTELLAFLFLTPARLHETPSTCLDDDLKPVSKANPHLKQQRDPLHRDDAKSATVLMTYSTGYQELRRYFGVGDQCLLVQIYPDKGATLDLAAASSLLGRQRYDATYVPTPDDASRYQAIRGNALYEKNPPPQQAPRMLVGWYTPGGLQLPSDPDWKLQLLTVYNNAGRPVAQFGNDKTHVIASLLISENQSGKPTAAGCRDDRVEDMARSQGKILSAQSVSTMDDGHGGTYATASHLTLLVGTAHNHDLFAFAGNKTTCAEIHISTVAGKPEEDARLQHALTLFRPLLDYKPTCADYMPEAAVFFKQAPMTGAPFYDACLKTLPKEGKSPDQIRDSRIATDQIVIALGMSGNLKQARQYAQHAIEVDPDYPLNYYNLACADAEEGKAAAARTHLEQAFARKENVLPGEKMPDPTRDDSILKLRKNQDFWTFVQTLGPPSRL